MYMYYLVPVHVYRSYYSYMFRYGTVLVWIALLVSLQRVCGAGSDCTGLSR